MYEEVEYQTIGAVAVIRLNRPETRNALTLKMRDELGSVLEEVAADRNIRAVYLTGRGDAFCAGGDLASMRNLGDVVAARERARKLHQWLGPALLMEKPIVCGINGPVVGAGVGLSLIGDIRIAAEPARYRAGFFSIGVVPDLATLYLLPKIIGMGRAAALLLTDRWVEADELKEIGIVERVVKREDLDAEALQLANQLTARPTYAIGLAKLLLRRSFDTPLEEFLGLEALAQAIAMNTQDFHEGVDAFFTRRQAQFKGE